MHHRPTTFPTLPPSLKSSMKMISSHLVTSPTTPMAPVPPVASPISTTKKHLLPPLPVTINPSLTPKTSESSPPSATLHVRNPISTKSPRFLLRPPLPPLSLQHLPLLVQFLRFLNRRKNESPSFRLHLLL
ncbi:hypothetical protein Golax_012066 [Gossypium laxum]|uniref:Uncharacterized protein n=1 Tax=Gossypium laxum TaxID=34288 RepID=A0A7J8ZMF7_9ROSI|nr:hypothetical protein [Gossypium laxum]